ncbi:MAG: ATP-grasp domain-containing protein [Pseudomonadota bacterium]
MDKQRLLILAPMSYGGRSLIKSAKKLNLQICIATRKNVFEEYSEELKQLIDEVLIVDYSHEQSVIEKICQYANTHPIHGIVAGFEFSSAMAVKTAHKLNLPTNDPTLADACREKSLMYQAFNANKVPMAKTYECSSLEECIEAASNLQFPVILKPCADAGSVNVLAVNSITELKTAFKKIRSKQLEIYHEIKLNDLVILQEFLQGNEVSVEIAVVKGSAHVLAVVNKITTHGPYFSELGHTLPSNLPIEEKENIARVAIQAVQALGIKNGVAHVEIKLTMSGPKVVEVGARLPGDKIVELLDIALGINEAAIYIQIALGKIPNIQATKSKYAAIRFKVPSQQGIIKEYINIETVMSLPGIVELELYKDKNAVVNNPESNLDRIGHVIAESTEYKKVCDIADKAIAKWQVVMER